MISTKKFQSIFNAINSDKLTLDISEVNEENIIEYAVIHKATNEAIFSTYDNRIYINANFDLDIHLLGTFESIDGCEKEITFQYDTEEVFIKDLIKILYFNDSNLISEKLMNKLLK
tara:strand:- start:204 stop:551 length:348 start_codon:yes stop_codon:yes gene_type:complete